MDFRLKAFLAVAENLSFTKAAKELMVSQPAVSKHVQELENTYKVKLFSRQGGHMELTAEGHALKKHAGQIVAAYDRMRLEMGLLREPVFGALRAGADTAAAGIIFKEAVPLFEKRFHNVQLSVNVLSVKELEESLRNGELDVVLVGDAEEPRGFRVYRKNDSPAQVEAFLAFVDLYK